MHSATASLPTVAIDLAKNVFQLYFIGTDGKPVNRRTRLSVALWAAFAFGAVPLFLVPGMAWAGDLYCNYTEPNQFCSGQGKLTFDLDKAEVDNVYGFYNFGDPGWQAEVRIVAGTVRQNVYGRYDDYVRANGNTVTLDGGTVGGNVYGGYSTKKTADGNTVTLNGSTLGNADAKVYGGYSESNLNTHNNTIILGAAFRGDHSNVSLYGGNTGANGNTLIVQGNGGITVRSIENFEKYEFSTGALRAGSDSWALTVSDQVQNITFRSADNVLFRFDSALNMDFGAKAGLLRDTSRSKFRKNFADAWYSSTLDNVADAPEVAYYQLAAKDHSDWLAVVFDRLYLYGEGGTHTPGQRETGNTLTLTGGTATAAYGGAANNGSDVTGNEVIIQPADPATFFNIPAIYGGHATGGSGVATNNTITLAATANLGNAQLYGGNTATITGNTLKVQANDITAQGIQNFDQYEFSAAALDADKPMLKLTNQGATLDIHASKVRFDTSGGAPGLDFGKAATLIEVQGGTGTLALTGTGTLTQWLDGLGSGLKEKVYNLAVETGNKLNLAFNELYLYGTGGTSNSPGQREQGNSLTLSATDHATAAFAGRALTGDVNGNTLTIDGAATLQTQTGNALSGNAYGGYADAGSATNNTVILTSNMAGKTAGFGIYGGNTGASGNTLEVQGNGITVSSINNFENLNFILPAATAAGATMLKVTGGAATVFAQMTNIGVAIAGGGSVLKMGDTVTLLTNAAGLENSTGGVLTQGTDYQQVNLTGRQGISLDYGFALDNDVNSIFAKVTTAPNPTPTPTPTPKPTPPQPVPPQPTPPQPTPPGPQVNPQTKAVVEGRAAGMGMLNLGADQIVRMTGNLPNRTGGGAPDFGGSADGKGAGAGAGNDTTVFAQLSGHRQKIETGSHVNVNGATAIVGAAKVLPLAGGGTAAVGAFFEYGDGSFKTHNGFDTGDVNGKGNSDYYGAGVLARVNLAGKDNGAPFVEGSVHAGRIHNNWHTDDLRDAATGQRAQYDIRTPYLGGHVGAGYRWQTNDTTQVEVFGQYLYTHMDGKDTTVALDPYSFRAVQSRRVRLGAKGAWAVSNTARAWAGAAWEREFDGTARATAYSFDVPAPTMKGNSAVIDAGLTFQPKRNLTTNVGVTGYAGKRKGASANVEVQYLF